MLSALGVLWLVGLVVMVWSLFMLGRNRRVYAHRMAVLDGIHKAAGRDIEEGRWWMWRYNEFEAVSYDTMLYKFWRPLDSFWPANPTRADR